MLRLFVFLITVCTAITAAAQPSAYAKQPVSIRAGILLIDSTASTGIGGQPTNADPYVFYNLDRRIDLKPPSWTFVNPLASGTVTADIVARWDAIYNALGLGNGPFTRGEPLTKNMAPYWEVNLSRIGPEALTSYDILLIHAPGNISLNPSDREKLRLFVDAGGILWFDKSTNQTVDAFNGLPIPFRTTNAGVGPDIHDPGHPILNYPYQLSYFDVLFIGAHNGRHAIQQETLADLGIAAFDRIASPVEFDFEKIHAIVENSAGIVIGIAQIGNGYVVLTSGNIVSPINEPAGGTTLPGLGRNSGPVGGDQFFRIPATELKFVYNLIGLNGMHPTLSKGSRRLNSSFDDLGAPLLQVWNDESMGFGHGDHSNFFPPAIFEGMVFVTTGNRLYVYKADPSTDLDGDGNNDDGLQDISLGATSDMVWRSTTLQEPLSSPVCVEVPNAITGVPDHQVHIVDGAGRVHIFETSPRDAQGRLLGPNPIAPVETIDPPGPPTFLDTSVNNRGPYTPVYNDGLMYVYDTYLGAGNTRLGRVWVIDCRRLERMNTAGTPWAAFGAGNPNMPYPGGSPTVGLIPVADGSGGQDLVMYVTNRSQTVGQSVGITSLWLGVRAESPNIVRTPSHIDVSTRAGTRGLRVFDQANSTYGIRIYLIDDLGIPLDPAATAAYLDGSLIQFAPGQLRFGLNQPLPNNIGVRLDYYIDWGSGVPNFISQVIRGQLFFPDDIQRRQYTVKSMALAPNGNLFVVTSNEFAGGSLFCIRENVRGQFNLLYRWDLYDRFGLTLSQTQTPIQIPAALQDRDHLTVLLPFLNQEPRRLHYHGGPVIYNNVCYVSVAGVKNVFGFQQQMTFLLAFDANPTPREIRLNGPIPAGLRLRQPDYAASNNKSLPERFVTLQANQADFQTEAGIIRFENSMSSTNGEMRNAFSASLPVIVSATGQPDQLIDPNANGNKWSPLLWYFAINGFRNEAPPMVMGNTLYIAGGNVLISLLRQNPPIPPDEIGAIFGMDAEIPPNHPSIITIPGQPGLKQVRWLYPANNPIGFESNKHVRWPSSDGIQSLDDFRIRLEQTALGISIQGLGTVGGSGTLVAWADDGIYGFRRALTVVADEGRVIETDSAGFVTWSTDMSYQLARSGGTRLFQTQPLVRPTKAYKLRENEVVVVDTGGDRLFIFDKSANEIRTIENILLDDVWRPNGWIEGSPRRFSQPRDVSVWTNYVQRANNPFTINEPLEFWVHYLVADTGNRRMIEVVDRYVARINDEGIPVVGGFVRDADGFPMTGQLFRVTPEELSGKTWSYTSVQRTWTGVDNNNINTFAYVAAIGDMMPTRVNTGLDQPNQNDLRESGGGSGGIVIFRRTGGTIAATDVINEILMPDQVTRKRLTGINSISLRPFRQNPQDPSLIDFAIMFTDSTGVYEIALNNAGNWEVIWMLTNQAYEAVRRVRLTAASARRLTNGNVLITNSYFGTTNQGATFHGEVTQWNDRDYNFTLPNLGFTTGSIKFELPPVVGSRGLRSPQFADRL